MEPHKEYLEDETGLYFLQNGIIHCIYHKNTVIDLTTIKKVIKNRNTLAAGIPRPLLLDLQGALYWTREAKYYTWVNKAHMLSITAIAPVVNSLAIKITVNWSIIFYPPSVPVKIFTKISPALEWLEKYKTKPPIKDPILK
jgi:hypothetical protein